MNDITSGAVAQPTADFTVDELEPTARVPGRMRGTNQDPVRAGKDRRRRSNRLHATKEELAEFEDAPNEASPDQPPRHKVDRLA